MSQETFIEKQEENIAIHIFSVSAAMVGVCLTVIAMKTKERYHRLLLKKIVDVIFLIGLVFMVGICIFIVRNLI